MRGVGEVYFITTFLTGISNGKEMKNATAFFFTSNKKLFLVTNKHVIYGKKNYGQNNVVSTPEIDAIRINLHINPKNLHENQEVTINLFEEGKKIWLEHQYTDIDIVLIPVTIDRTKYLISSITRELIECDNVVVDDFEEIFLLGYPYGYYDRYNNLPVVRVGHLVSAFGAHHDGYPVMMGDMITHDGMSGGPVLMRIKDFVTRENDYKEVRVNAGSERRILVGVYSGQFQINEKNEKERANLITIWFAKLILDILSFNGL